MTSKEYFEQAILLNQKINSYQHELDQLRAMTMSISSPIFGAKVQTPAAHEARFVRDVERFMAFEERINAEIDALYDLKTEMEEVINALASDKEQLVLRYRYICNMTWKEIGVHLDVDLRTAQRWHELALAHVVIPKCNKRI